jgi:8-amino-7-oxononanoate synthase
MGHALRHLAAELAALERAGLLRHAMSPDPSLLNLSSNDYLGYGDEPFPQVHTRSGAGASRLVSGTDASHERAEAALAEWLGAEAALLFSSGFAANVGVLTALASAGDVVFSDALNHASLIDGCRLSGARVQVFPHLDAEALAHGLASAGGQGRRWVVTESYFSMDADTPALQAYRQICDRYDAALVVDEAHALGVFGPAGRGICAQTGVRPDVLIGTAGKALGLQGAFVVGSRDLRSWLWNRARTFVFSTGVCPSVAEVIAGRVARAAADDDGRARLWENTGAVRRALASFGAQVLGVGPVIPWIIGESAEALELARAFRREGVLVHAMRPPTVAAGTARLRLTARATLTPTDLGTLTRTVSGFVGGARPALGG